MDERSDARRLRLRILFYSLLWMFVSSLLVAVLCLLQLNEHLRKDARSDLMAILKGRTAEIEGYIGRMRDIAGQISSRTAIAEKLEEYNNGLVTLDALQHFCTPKLLDPMSRSADLVGLARLDIRGNSIVQLGVPVPESLLRPPDGGLEIAVGGPVRIGDYECLWTFSPVLNKRSEPIGADVLLFAIYGLRDIVTDREGLRGSGQVFVCERRDGAASVFLASGGRQSWDAIKGDSPIGAALAKALRNESGAIIMGTGGRDREAVYGPVRGVPWGVVVSMARDDIYASADYQVRMAGNVIIVMLLIGAPGMVFILRPLTGNIIIREDRFRAQIVEKTEALREELEGRKKVEQKLRESEEMHRRLFEMESDAIILVENSTGRILEANAAALALYGRSRSEILRLKNIDLSAEPDRTMAATAERLPVVPIRYHKHRSGVVFPVEITARHFSLQGREVHIAAVRDITERLRAEEALRESEERFRSSFEHAASGMAIVGIEGQFLQVNAALCRMLGWSESELLGMNRAEALHPDEPLEMGNAFGCNGSSLAGVHAERRYVHRDGRTVSVMEGASVVCNPQGERLYYIVQLQDVSASKAMEAEKRKLEMQLRQAQKMEAVGSLAGGIAHDFNNILAPIIGYTEIMMMGAGGNSSMRHDLEQVLKAALRAKELVRQILTFSRMRTEVERKPIDLIATVEDALKFLRASLPSTIELRWSFTCEQAVILADPTQVHQVLVNLCTNAAHAMEATGGAIEVVVREEFLDSPYEGFGSAMAPGRCVKLSVVDSGCGMDRETLERVFDPYFTTKEVGKGSGLGLAVVHGIVKRHGGVVDVDSEPGVGSCFHVYLPMLDEAPVPMDVEAPPLCTGTGSILFVDDEEALVEVVGRMLESLGYNAVTRTSGVDALELFKTQPDRFDLVITDYTMPHMTGGELTKKLVRIRPDIPVILCSGFNETINEDTAKDAGAAMLLTKPLNLHGLANAVRTAVDGRAGRG
jgi:PAS domain S-box-containing protein